MGKGQDKSKPAGESFGGYVVKRFFVLSCIVAAALAAFQLQQQIPAQRFIKTPAEMSARMMLSFRLLMISGSVVAFFIAVMMQMRLWTSAIDPITNKDGPMVTTMGRVVTNSCEQFILHAFAVLAVTTISTQTSYDIVYLQVFCFVVGRLLFGIGYMIHPSLRSLGMAFGTLPTLYAIAITANFYYTFGIDHGLHTVAKKN